MSIEKVMERPKSLTATAKESIRSAIVSGELAFGCQLSESALALRLGVSKTPVREALLQLKLEGLVEILPQSGTLVFSPTEEEVRKICRFREIIEASALELAMGIDAERLAQKLTLSLSMPKGRIDKQKFRLQHDADFHRAILDACGNDYLQSAYQLIADKINALRARLPTEDDHIDACIDMHGDIVKLVRDGNIKKACSELRMHIRSTEESYIGASGVVPTSEK
jgi:DNA-binding GntR family transcriptional regulator